MKSAVAVSVRKALLTSGHLNRRVCTCANCWPESSCREWQYCALTKEMNADCGQITLGNLASVLYPLQKPLKKTPWTYVRWRSAKSPQSSVFFRSLARLHKSDRLNFLICSREAANKE